MMRDFLALYALVLASLVFPGKALMTGKCQVAKKSAKTRKFSTFAPRVITTTTATNQLVLSRAPSALVDPLYLSLSDAESASGEEVSPDEETKSSSSNEEEKLTQGLTTRQKLAKMGLSALLSYGWISNVSYTVGMSIAWYLYSKRSGLSPLAGGRGGSSWKEFLAVYAGIWVFNNIIRPLRLAAAVAVTPYFDRMIESVQQKTNFSRPIAIALVVFLFNIIGTISLLVGGITLASIAAGVPVFPGKT